LVEKLNDKGITKKALFNLGKEDLKPILREIFEEYLSFGGLEKSPKENWSKACQEILQEYQAANDGKMGNIQIDEDEDEEENEDNV
jgi:hypothetical protein